MNGVELVLFDLDGTLLETAPEIRDALNDTLQAFGFAPAPLARVERWIGHGTGALLLEALAHATAADAATVRASEAWTLAQARFAADLQRRCGTASRPYPHAREVLQALAARGVRRALVTNKEQRFALALLRRHALGDAFDRVVCGDSLPTKKPDPAGVLDCLRSFGVQPQRALFVGDSAIDVATARNAGVRVWALAHGYNGGEPIAAARPDRVIDSLSTLLEENLPCH